MNNFIESIVSWRGRAIVVMVLMPVLASGQQQMQQQQFQQELIRQGYQHQQDMMNAPSSAGTERYVDYSGGWGALAKGDNESGTSFGTAASYPTKKEAKAVALRRCGIDAVGCKVVLTYANSCMAVGEVKDFSNSEKIKVSYSVWENIEKSKARAVESCEEMNDGQACQVVYSTCSFYNMPPE